MAEKNLFKSLRNRIFQEIAAVAPGAATLRVQLHRWRGVKIGRNAWIGYQAMLDNAYPDLLSIGDNVSIGIRTTLIAHFRETQGIWIEDDVFVGPCCCVLPGVRLGKGCVVSAGSVVTTSVPPAAVVQGNPARIVAMCASPLLIDTSMRVFLRGLTPVR
jgi:acetyltransferase-like isoleucine patch superfamily enzyme